MFDKSHFGFRSFDDEMPLGPRFGHWFGHGGMGPHHFFRRGILKFVILSLIKEQPRHGYDIIQELENKFHGMYSPSAGTVYPILQLLEDQGYVTIDQKDGKKVYSVTSDGEKYLDENQEVLDRMQSLRNHFKEKFGPEVHDLKREIVQTIKLIRHGAHNGALKDPKTLQELQKAISDFRQEVEMLLSKHEEK